MCWNNTKYNEFIKYLYSLQDIKYRDFSKSLMPSKNEYELIGIKIPLLKKIAKDISKNNYIEFININKHDTFEEILIHGLIIGYIKEDINTIINYSKEYIPYISNWALCDSYVANLHIMNKYPNKCLTLVKWCLKHKKEYYKRAGYVLLLNYMIKDEYIDTIFELCNNNDSDDYYVKMAVAWLISEVYPKYPNKTLEYLKNNKLDKWTHNKSIQKIRESNRIDKETKDMLIEWKR